MRYMSKYSDFQSLNEAKKDAASKFVDKGLISMTELDKIATIDPSKNGNYISKITDWYLQNKPIKLDTYLDKMKTNLQYFEELKKRNKLQKKDINQYHSLAELENAVKEIKFLSLGKGPYTPKLDKDYTVEQDDDHILALNIKNHKTMQFFGYDSGKYADDDDSKKWCVAMINPKKNFWKEYTDTAHWSFFVIVKKNEPKNSRFHKQLFFINKRRLELADINNQTDYYQEGNEKNYLLSINVKPFITNLIQNQANWSGFLPNQSNVFDALDVLPKYVQKINDSTFQITLPPNPLTPNQLNFNPNDLDFHITTLNENMGLQNLQQHHLDLLKNFSFPNIHTLEIYDSNLPNIDAISLRNFQNLSQLKASSINLLKLPDFNNLPNLQLLDVSYNQISNLEPLKNLTNLKFLDAAFNQITYAAPLKNLHHLSFLDLTGNPISDTTTLTNMKKYVKILNADLNHNHYQK